MANNSIVVQTLDEVLGIVRGVEGYQNKVFEIYTEDDLQDYTKNITLPAAGVVYDGLRPVAAGASGPRGVSAELVFSVLIVFKKEAMTKTHPARGVLETLDAIRGAFRAATAPSNHKWKFVAEAPVSVKANLLVYVQRWSCPVQLV